MKHIDLTYSRAIRLAREIVGLSQLQLAKKADLTPSYVSLLESDRRTPSVKVMGRLAYALGTTPTMLSILASASPFLSESEYAEVGRFVMNAKANGRKK